MLSKSIGWMGLIALQFNSIPLIISASAGLTMPITTPMLSIFGLCCYLYHSIFVRRDVLYTVGNTIGIIANSTLIYFIVR
jgi:hypothetical protein